MEKIHLRKNLFGKHIDIILFGVDRVLAEDFADEAYREALRLSKIFNFYDSRSELSRLNKKRKMKVSEELLEVVKLAKRLSELTDGEYDVSKGKIFRRQKNGGQPAKVSCSYKDIELKGSEIKLNNLDVEIDLGSIAKGYIVDKVVEKLKSLGIVSGIVDGRGDIRIFGSKQEVGIQHPRKKEEIICKIELQEAAVATSGDYNQYYKTPEKSHILNQKDLISVSVVAQDLMTADAFATAIFVSEEKKIKRLVKENKNIKIMTIDKNLNNKFYNDFEEIIKKNYEK